MRRRGNTFGIHKAHGRPPETSFISSRIQRHERQARRAEEARLATPGYDFRDQAPGREDDRDDARCRADATTS